ncbi:MAG: bacteriophage abortive infection AbiH family protein [Atopobiaceae bacterium]|jgi:hypothetical protein|nr:bacteriophage abortive infection AbiH family protein [Atopobiaceae bacterium]
MNLYILGNGFDLAHHLPTSYENDYNIIVKNTCSSELWDKLNELYFSCGGKPQPKLWSEFESRVGFISDEEEKRLRDTADGKLDELREVASDDGIDTTQDRDIDMQLFDKDDEIDCAVPSRESMFQFIPFEDSPSDIHAMLNVCMEEMVEAANDKLSSTKPIGTINPESYFITFNYTNTLEDVYQIDESKILHIHGKLNEPLIWGNDKHVIEGNVIDVAPNYDSIIDGRVPYGSNDGFASYSGYAAQQDSIAQGSTTVSDASDVAVSTLSAIGNAMVKTIDVNKLVDFINVIPGDVSTIYVLGHSLGSVDGEYFEQIDKRCPRAKWVISYRCKKDRLTLKKAANSLLGNSSITFRQFGTLFQSTSGPFGTALSGVSSMVVGHA